VKAKGEGGLDEMIKFLRDDEILFGLLSLPVNDTQKLALLIWIGDGTPFSLRAGIIYHQASIAQFFQVRLPPPDGAPRHARPRSLARERRERERERYH
jgi:hypothetical protein